MPRYFFNVRDESGLTLDREGGDLPDKEAAMGEAEQAARELAADAIRRGAVIPDRHIEVVDDAGTLVGTCDLRRVIHSGKP